MIATIAINNPLRFFPQHEEQTQNLGIDQLDSSPLEPDENMEKAQCDNNPRELAPVALYDTVKLRARRPTTSILQKIVISMGTKCHPVAGYGLQRLPGHGALIECFMAFRHSLPRLASPMEMMTLNITPPQTRSKLHDAQVYRGYAK